MREQPGAKFTGKVTRTAGAIDANSRTLHTEIQTPNPDRKLLSGMYAQVKLSLARNTPPLILPNSALIVNADGTQVATVKDGRVRFRAVSVENDNGPTFSVNSGLSDRIR